MLINIQFLRFLAAMLVVFYHSAAHVRASGHGLGVFFEFGQSAGFAGVDIFFVISGFIMAWTTVDAAGGYNAISFAKRRVARIYSGYWPFYLLALGLFTQLGGQYLVNKHYISSALLWPTELRHLLIPVSWTLIFEIWFYLIFALLIAFGGAHKSRMFKLVTLAVAGWSLYTHFGRHAYDPGVLENMNLYEQYLAFPYLLEFMAGVLLADRLRGRPGGLAWTPLVAGILLFVLGGWINDQQFGGHLIKGYYIIWRVLIFGSASVMIVAGLVRLENRGLTLPGRFSLQAGAASYALYLSHTLILAATQKMGFNGWTAHLPAWQAQTAFLALVTLIVVYSMAHYRLIERPLHRVFRGWLRV